MSSKGKPSLDFSKLFYPNLQREYVPELLKRHGDFLLRKASDSGRVLSVNCRGELRHYRFGEPQKPSYTMEGKTYNSLEDMISHYYQTESKWAGKNDEVLRRPIENTVELIEHERLKLLQELGKGNFGQVWRATLMPKVVPGSSVTDGGEEVAIKMLAQNTSDEDRAECLAEARLMSGLQHDNVVKLKGLTFSREDEAAPTKMMIVLEYCNMGSLDKLLQKNMVKQEKKAYPIVDAAKGMVYLHENSIVHRDLACRNLLVRKTGEKLTTKVADFGLSRSVATAYKMATKRRLPVFSTPPEALKTRSWTSGSDVWSFGVLMQEVYSGGKNPYETHFGKMGLKEVVSELTGGFRLPTPETMPPELARLSLRCMANVAERPTMKEVLEELMRLVDQSRR